MTLEQMLTTVISRTHYTNKEPVIIQELNSALSEVWQRLYRVFPNVKLTFETTGTFASETQQFDLATEIGNQDGTFYGHKTFYIKGTSDENYIAVIFMDTNDSRFQSREQEDAQVIQPTFASAVNFGEVRFAPAVPANTQWRSDWIGKPPNLSLSTQCVTSIPEPLHQAMTDLATANVFNIMDDTREVTWSRKAEAKISSAIQTIKRREFQTRQGTTGYPPRSGTWLG